MNPWLDFCQWRQRRLVAAAERLTAAAARWDARYAKGRAKLDPIPFVKPATTWPADDPRPHRPPRVRDSKR